MTAGPVGRRLAAELRRLRQETGLSMVALAAGTPFSKSSWERYLNGKALPPRQAVQALCRLAATPPGRALALWELAEAEWSAPGPAAVPPAPGAALDAHTNRPPAAALAGTPASRRLRPGIALGAVLVCLCAAAAAAALTGLQPHRPTGTPEIADAKCRAQTCTGHNPLAMLCATPSQVLAERRIATGTGLQIHYNPRCQAAWVQLWQTRVGDRVQISTPGTGPESVQVTDQADAEGNLDTPMIPATPGTPLHACLLPADNAARTCITSHVG